MKYGRLFYAHFIRPYSVPTLLYHTVQHEELNSFKPPVSWSPTSTISGYSNKTFPKLLPIPHSRLRLPSAGVNKARQCLQELDLAERKLLHLSPPMAFKDNDTRGTDNTDTEPCAGSSAATVGDGSVGSKRSCCGEAASIPDSDSGARVAHDHSHHGYTHGHDHGGNHGQQRSVSTPSCEGASAAEHNSSISTGDAANVVNSDLAGDCEGGDAVKERERAMRVLRRARAMCRVAEGGCFLRKGRAAQATEVLRDLLLEVGDHGRTQSRIINRARLLARARCACTGEKRGGGCWRGLLYIQGKLSHFHRCISHKI